MTIQVNADSQTVDGFGDEWSRFDQRDLPEDVRNKIFQVYFAVFPKDVLTQKARGADFGVGSGRWAQVVAPTVGKLVCVDASKEALDVARRNLADLSNCEFVLASVEQSGIAPNSLDFAYSLGVLHHIPDTEAALHACVQTLKPGAPFLVYLYFRFDNKPAWYAFIWKISELVRRVVSKMPYSMRYFTSQLIAVFVYWPLSRLGRLLKHFGVRNFPLAFYGDKPFYVLRTDALDRFGTRLEQRFTKSEITAMMERSGLTDIVFGDVEPYWVAVGRKKMQ